MKIERLIEIYTQLLPIYEKGYKEKHDRQEIITNKLDEGLCWAARKNNITTRYKELADLFDFGYYEKTTSNTVFSRYTGYLFPKPETWQDLKTRIDFMKSEIKDLKRLLKQGYTHV